MIITKTPLRISLLGGNTDYPAYFKKYGGAVLTMTIDKYLYCIVSKRFDDMIYVNYSIKEKVKKVSEVKHKLVREALRLTGVHSGIEITFLSDIPSEGSGLGSSSAVTIGVLNALHNYKGESVTAKQLAEEACRIEIDILKHPIGIQDQYAIAFGGFNLIEFKDIVKVTPVEPNGLDESLMLLYTGITRDSNKVLAKMKLNKRLLDEIKAQVYHKLDTITDPLILGQMMDRYWGLKKELNKYVSNRKIDKMYLKTLLFGSQGGKIVGAGAGGFLLIAPCGPAEKTPWSSRFIPPRSRCSRSLPRARRSLSVQNCGPVMHAIRAGLSLLEEHDQRQLGLERGGHHDGHLERRAAGRLGGGFARRAARSAAACAALRPGDARYAAPNIKADKACAVDLGYRVRCLTAKAPDVAGTKKIAACRGPEPGGFPDRGRAPATLVAQRLRQTASLRAWKCTARPAGGDKVLADARGTFGIRDLQMLQNPEPADDTEYIDSATKLPVKHELSAPPPERKYLIADQRAEDLRPRGQLALLRSALRPAAAAGL